MPKISPSQDEFDTLRELIRRRSGISLSDNKIYFLSVRLNSRMAQCNISSVQEYYYYIKYDSHGDEELNKLMDAVTINETHFFRDKSQLDMFQVKILPVLMLEKVRQDHRRLRIWSAACSTGEEAYTIGIILLETIKNICSWKVEVIATDISDTVLTSARAGLYNEYALRDTDVSIIRKYFLKNRDAQYRIHEDVSRIVRFGHVNLVDSTIAGRFKDMDLIFCRNLIIYFDEEHKRVALENVYRSLNAGGFLLLGYAESLQDILMHFEMRRFGAVAAYQKKRLSA